MAVKNVTKKPSKQRKKRIKAPLHIKRKFISAHLSKELREKYKRRSFPVRSGDTVKVMRGKFKGHEAKVEDVDYGRGVLIIDGVTLTRADGTEVPRPIQPSNVMITKLNLEDKRRVASLERRMEGA
jgi:large subunit ribosomal protein L24